MYCRTSIRTGFGPRLLAMLQSGVWSIVLLAAGSSQAATLTVTTNADSGAGSLRAALAAAAADDTIDFDAALHGQTIVLQSTLSVTKNLTITGPGASRFTIDGNHAVQVFSMGNTTVAISGLTIANGNAGSNGGGIYSNGALTVTDCTLSGNVSRRGGGIYSVGTLNVSGSTFVGNSASTGGGISSDGSAATISNSTFVNNASVDSGGGGGGLDKAGGTLTVHSSTFVGNTTRDHGGAIGSQATVVVNNSLFSGNSATNTTGRGGAIGNLSNVANVSNSVFWQNSAPSNDDCINCAYVNQITGDPMLAPLADNGGYTATMLPGIGSSAIDAGDDALCAASPVNGLDQRGIARPQGAHCDVGAVEAYPPRTLTVTVSGHGTVSAAVAPAPVSGAITDCDSSGGGHCSADYVDGSTATLSAVAANGWRFSQWSTDCSGNTATSSVTMTAARHCAAAFLQNPPPIANAQSVNVAFNTAQAITITGSDAYPNGAFAHAIVMSPSNGTIEGFNSATGTLTYVPTLGYAGVDSFTFTVTNGNGTSTPATVTITVTAGVLPVAQPTSASVAFNTAAPIILGASDANPGGPFAFVYAIVTPPAHGTVTTSGNIATYTPTLGYAGADSFTFTASDVNGTSTPATVTITVAAGVLPVAQATSANVPFNTAASISLGASDSNPGGPFTFTYAIAATPAHGTITLSGNNATYTPTLGYAGADSFTFTASDVNGTSTPATVTITVAAGLLPVAQATSANVPFNTAVSIELGASDSNPGGPFDFTYAIAAPPAHGTVTLGGSSATYTPTLGYTGADGFTFTASDVNGTSAPATVTITVIAGVLPVAQATTASVVYNTASPITLSASDSNPGGPFDFTYAIAAPPAHGTVTISGNIATYTPAPDYRGADAFTYTTTNVNGTSAPAAVTIVVTAGIVAVPTLGTWGLLLLGGLLLVIAWRREVRKG
jgi:hypothetical protein